MRFSALFAELTKNTLWSKARIGAGRDDLEWRIASCGHWIRFRDFGDAASTFGWDRGHPSVPASTPKAAASPLADDRAPALDRAEPVCASCLAARAALFGDAAN